MKINEIILETQLNELFKQPTVPWKWGFRGSEEVEADFMVGDIQYKFYAYSFNSGPESHWEVEFKVVEGGNPGNRFGVTGTGNAAVVMSTIVDITKQFIKDYYDKIDVLVFSAKERSRRDLYARMVHRLIPEWALQRNGGYFELTKPIVNHSS